jgi:hypothetical protein
MAGVLVIYKAMLDVTWKKKRVIEECYLKTAMNSWQLEKEITHRRMIFPNIS